MRFSLILLTLLAFSNLVTASEGVEFELLPPPEPTEWRSVFPEPEQSWDRFLEEYRNVPIYSKRVLEVLPLELDHAANDIMRNELKEYLSIFFMTNVVILEKQKVPNAVRRRQANGYGIQMLAGDVIRTTSNGRHASLLARLTLTSKDLYARYNRGYLNFLYGLASFRYKGAVVSGARLAVRHLARTENSTLQNRLLKIATHELTHTLNIAHCQKYKCLMNGLNTLKELDKNTMYLCPDCTKKIEHALGYDSALRQELLCQFYTKIEQKDMAEFARIRARQLRAELLRRKN